MAMVFRRHPRYAVTLLALIVTTFVFLSPHDAFHSVPAPVSYVVPAPDLPARILRSENSYQRMLDQRQDMIKKFGPSPSQVVMFPPDQEPWPAYTVWDFFPPVFNCPHEAERIGALGDGGKWVCGLSRIAEKPDCVVYSFGIDWDSSFEAEVLTRTRHCEIWGYDSVETGFGSQIPRAQRHRTHFSRVGLAAADSHGFNDEPKLWTLKSLMKANGHTHIDILHIDIEGYEFEVMRALAHDFVSDPSAPGTPGVLPFGQLIIEMHVWHQRFTDFLAWWQMLEGAGLRPFMAEVNLVYANYNRQSGVELADYSFINIAGDNIFIVDPSSTGAGIVAHPAYTLDDARDADDEPDVRTIRHAVV
ncbi:methyltransferase domain-containing protein [Sparassis latifolia]